MFAIIMTLIDVSIVTKTHSKNVQLLLYFIDNSLVYLFLLKELMLIYKVSLKKCKEKFRTQRRVHICVII